MYHCPCWKEVREQILEELLVEEQKATTPKALKVANGLMSNCVKSGQCRSIHLSVHRWESEKSHRLI